MIQRTAILYDWTECDERNGGSKRVDEKNYEYPGDDAEELQLLSKFVATHDVTCGHVAIFEAGVLIKSELIG